MTCPSRRSYGHRGAQAILDQKPCLVSKVLVGFIVGYTSGQLACLRACAPRALQQAVRVTGLLRMQGNPDGRIGIDFLVAGPERDIQRAQGFIGRQKGDGRPIDRREHAGELVPAQFAKKISGPQHIRAKHGHHPLAHGIADVIAPDRIDASDHPTFDEKYRQGVAVGLARDQSLAQQIGKLV